MSKRIRTLEKRNGTVMTHTMGTPEGELPSFDVSIISPPAYYKEATKMEINLGGGVILRLNGRQFRTLARVCKQQESAIDGDF